MPPFCCLNLPVFFLLLPTTESPTPAELGLSWSGWLTMLLSVGGVTVLFALCLWRVLHASPAADATEDAASRP